MRHALPAHTEHGVVSTAPSSVALYTLQVAIGVVVSRGGYDRLRKTKGRVETRYYRGTRLGTDGLIRTPTTASSIES